MEGYGRPLLNDGHQMTELTSIVPPSNNRIGTLPKRKMYTTNNLEKCWTPGFHYKKFKKAFYKVNMMRLAISNYHTILDIKHAAAINQNLS